MVLAGSSGGIGEPRRTQTGSQGREGREEAAAQARPEVTVTARSGTLLSIAFLAVVPGAPLVAAKLALLLALLCAAGRAVAIVADVLLGGTDDLP